MSTHETIKETRDPSRSSTTTDLKTNPAKAHPECSNAELTGQELLQEYRRKVLTIRALEEVLERCGSSGAPKQPRSSPLLTQPRTNDPAAASNQLADGLTAMVERQRAELVEMWPAVRTVLSGVPDPRIYLVLYQFYALGCTVEDIAEAAYLSPRTVARLKTKGLAAL